MIYYIGIDISKYKHDFCIISNTSEVIVENSSFENNGKMVKHGSGHLRYSIMNAAMIILRYSPTFYDYYLKKRSEGKCHRVALSCVKNY